MTGEEIFAAEPKNFWRKKPSYIAALVLTVLAATALVYGFAKVYGKQTEELQSELAEISKQKEILERKRAKIAEQLEKTRLLVEKSKDASPAVDAHIQVLSGSCLSCPTPAWIESYRTAFASLEEIEKIINEDDAVAESLQKKSEN